MKSNTKDSLMNPKEYIVRWRLVKMAGTVNCVDCNKQLRLKEAIHTPPTGLIPSGFRCAVCEEKKWDNA